MVMNMQKTKNAILQVANPAARPIPSAEDLSAQPRDLPSLPDEVDCKVSAQSLLQMNNGLQTQLSIMKQGKKQDDSSDDDDHPKKDDGQDNNMKNKKNKNGNQEKNNQEKNKQKNTADEDHTIKMHPSELTKQNKGQLKKQIHKLDESIPKEEKTLQSLKELLIDIRSHEEKTKTKEDERKKEQRTKNTKLMKTTADAWFLKYKDTATMKFNVVEFLKTYKEFADIKSEVQRYFIETNIEAKQKEIETKKQERKKLRIELKEKIEQDVRQFKQSIEKKEKFLQGSSTNKTLRDELIQEIENCIEYINAELRLDPNADELDISEQADALKMGDMLIQRKPYIDETKMKEEVLSLQAKLSSLKAKEKKTCSIM